MFDLLVTTVKKYKYNFIYFYGFRIYLKIYDDRVSKF